MTFGFLEILVEEPSSRATLDVLVPRIVPEAAFEIREFPFIGDVPALRRVYPRLPSSTGEKAKYRAPDEIPKASRALEALLQEHNYHKGGLRKLELASDVAPHMDVDNNNSVSFQCFRDGLRRLVKGEN